uniref:Hydrogenase maturation protease n=1 Tax=Fervidicoccus fontis TaxID=683846 RepID=A0A7J3ZKS0_9CREN
MLVESARKKLVIIGIGNLLLSDEGVGVHVVSELKRFELPAYVEVYDGATLGLEILSLMEGASKAIIVDAVRGGGKPGTIYRFNLRDFEYETNVLRMTSMHHLDFATALKLGEGAYSLPEEVIVIGIEPSRIDVGLELSDEVRAAIPEVLKIILEEIHSFSKGQE